MKYLYLLFIYFSIKTDGINIDVMLQSDQLLQLNKLNCNNIHDMARWVVVVECVCVCVRERERERERERGERGERERGGEEREEREMS